MTAPALTMRLERAADGTVRHVPTAFVPPAPRGRKKRTPPDPIKTSGDAGAEQLKQLVERLERLQEERDGINDDIRDVEAEGKSMGFDIKGVRAILSLRKMEKHHRDEAEAILETYKAALGLA